MTPSFLARACAALALALPLAASAQAYPDKPIKLIVPFSPGGGNDTVARAISQQLSTSLKEQVVVDNRPGAGGVLGADLAAHAPADGYTLFLGGVGSHAVNPNLHRHLPYDAVKDFAPIVLIASAPSVLVVYPGVPAKTIQEYAALAKAQPGKITFASNGNGSSAHLAGAMFESMAGVKMLHVPYKGLSPALTDLLAGQVNSMFSSVVAIVPQIKAGKLRALAVTSKKRSALLPEVPTVAESGWPAYEAGSWYGLLAPAGTPRDRVMKINTETNKALANPAVRNTLAQDGSVIVGGSPEDFGNYIKGEIARMGKVIRDSHIEMAE
ncbi:MAG TPA: tripartite tricarboxylate transporter substrate binding protein [Burkholderiales bacterium]|jgi:tripartite-type tricarboxylate transporter receptor subunit TctC